MSRSPGTSTLLKKQTKARGDEGTLSLIVLILETTVPTSAIFHPTGSLAKPPMGYPWAAHGLARGHSRRHSPWAVRYCPWLPHGRASKPVASGGDPDRWVPWWFRKPAQASGDGTNYWRFYRRSYSFRRTILFSIRTTLIESDIFPAAERENCPRETTWSRTSRRPRRVFRCS